MSVFCGVYLAQECEIARINGDNRGMYITPKPMLTQMNNQPCLHTFFRFEDLLYVAHHFGHRESGGAPKRYSNLPSDTKR